MKRFCIVVAIVLGAVAGCQAPPMNEAKQEAQKRWCQARAVVLYGVAGEHLKAGQLTSAQRRVQEALSLDPEYLDARILLAKVHIEQGHYAPAVAELENVRAERPESSEVIYLLGVAQEKQGHLPEALASYRRAYALDDSSLDPVMAAVEVLAAMGRLREAELYVQSYLGVADEEPGMFELAGRLAMMRKDYPAAADHYLRAHELAPKNLRYREALARAQVLANRFADAADTLRGLTRQKEYEAPTWVYTMLGDCHMALLQPLQARDAYQVAGDRAPAVPAVWTNLAKALLALGDTPRAVLSARRALQLDGRFLDAAMVLGYSLLRDGQPAEAVTVLTEATAIHPRESMLKCLLGRAHAAKGDEAEAMRCYAAALRLEPENAVARELLNQAGRKTLSSTR